MSIVIARRFTLVFAFCWSLSACDGGGTLAPVPSGTPTNRPLIPATYYMHTADGEALSAEISNRFIGVSPETTILDSARLLVSGNNTYQQRYWYRVMITGTLDRSELVIDEGSWRAAQVGYVFTSTLRNRTFGVTVPSLGTILSSEQMVFFNGAPLTEGFYRLTRP